MDFEVCIDSVEGAILASKHGAKRVELCTALNEGGLTPSSGMIEACVKASSAEVFVMIRPHAGGFVYDEQNLLLMERDIVAAHHLGAHGVVFGVLTLEGKVDIKKNLFLMETALKLGLGTTFHRAIDVCKAPLAEIEHIINLGFDRILTSGGKAKAIEGTDLIQKMATLSNGRIEIMAGSGINPGNTSQFLALDISAIHFTARKEHFNDLKLDMGMEYVVDEDKISEIALITRTT